MRGSSDAPAQRFDRGEHPSLRAAICDAIRRDILDAKLPPGKRIIIKELRTQFRVGLSAVREALCQLAADGLVAPVEQHGFRVAPISRHDLSDLTRARTNIEVFAIRDAVAHGESEWASRLVSCLQQLTRLERPSARYAAEHRRFHDLLVEPCQSEWMKRFRATLHQHSERYRRLAPRRDDRTRNINAEHQALVDAVIARDGELAARLIGEHILATERALSNLGFTIN